MNKNVIFAFRGDPMCFVHVLLNGLELDERGLGGEIVVEGDAVPLIIKMADPSHFLHQLFSRARKRGLILGACRACSTKLKVAGAIEELGVPLIGSMSGHPSMAEFIEQGYTVITF